jgi:monofunctional glycosyltransferase
MESKKKSDSKSSPPSNFAIRAIKGFFFGFFWTLRMIWLIIWTLYQIALGAVLVGLIWGGFKVGEYFSLWEIRKLQNTNPPTTTFIEAQRSRLVDSLRAKGFRPRPETLIAWTWIPFDSIPKMVREVALVAEDAKFYEHEGFDLEQIEYALVANHQAGKPARGASTITQQVAKNLFLSKDKELSRKLREAVITIEMEQLLTKDRILELYLNVAQFDDNVFGIREASRHYLNKELRQLSPDEVINLICLLPSPSKWNFKKPNNAYLQHKRLVFRNYVMYKGIKQMTDTTQMNWQDTVYIRLSNQLAEERWKTLRTGPYQDPGDSVDENAPEPDLEGPQHQGALNESTNPPSTKPEKRGRTF